MPEALDFWTVWVFISRQGVLFECLSNTLTHPPLLTHSLACSRFLFDARAIVLSGSCCFYWVANPRLLHPQRWKREPVCGNIVSKPLSKKDSYHHSFLGELHFPCFPLIRAEGDSGWVLLVKEQRQTGVTERDVNKFSLSGAAHWVTPSVRLHRCDSVCLHDYWKVSLLRGANRITLFYSGPCSSLSLTNYTVIVSRRCIKIWHWQAFWKRCIGIGVWTWQSSKLVIAPRRRR